MIAENIPHSPVQSAVQDEVPSKGPTTSVGGIRMMWLLAGLFSAAFALIGITVYVASLRQDRLQRAFEESIVKVAVSSLERRLGDSVLDYAHWDDAVQNLVLAFDKNWAARNIGPTLQTTFDYDLSLVIDGQNRALYGQLHGVEDRGAAGRALMPGLDELALRARRSMAGSAEPVRAVVTGSAGVFAFAASPILPETGSSLALPAGPASVLLFARELDAAFLADLAYDYGLSRLNIGTMEEPAGVPEVTLLGPNREPVARIHWSQRRPGRDQLTWIIPALLGALLTVGTFTILALRDLRQAQVIARSEGRWRESEIRFRSLVENLRGIIFCRGIAGHSEHGYDQNGAQLFGADTASIAGIIDEYGRARIAHWYEAIDPIDRPAYLAAEEARKVNGTSYALEYRIIHPNTGELRWMREVAWVVDDADDGRRYFDSFITDVTDQRRQAGAIAALANEAQRADRAKSEFLTAMSHEIRTPLTGVLGMADLLAAADLPSRERSYVDAIRASGRHLLSVINDVLDFSRIEAGRLEIDHVAFELTAMIEQVRSVLAALAAERCLQLSFNLDSGCPPILRGDPTRINQILLNLVGNALKFTIEGSVEVRVRVTHPIGDAVNLRIDVQDTGIGIPADKLGDLFEPFVQAERSTNRRFGGSGLGLVICKRLVEAMGGAIGVESEFGQGSHFWFELPLEVGDALATAKVAVPDLVVRPLRVLVAEDVALNRELLGEMLGRQQHNVEFAENGAEAVHRAAAAPFDSVLMDAKMPVMDGIEATRRIRALPGPASKLPIIGLTANVMHAERTRYLAAGMDVVLNKPVAWPELFATIGRLTSGSAGAEQVISSQPPRSITPLLDDNVLAGLANWMQSHDLARFLNSALIQAESAQRELVGLDAHAKETKVIAHRLRGTAASFGFARIASCAGSIDACTADGPDMTSLVSGLTDAIAATRAALEERGGC
jgi:signal transduction histidine kinase/CheY-like chemotaxis protein